MFQTSSFTHHVSRIAIRASLLLAALSVLAWAPDPQTGSITVTGQVTNGTAGGSVPGDLPITLHVFSDAEETGTYTAALAADHAFRFVDVAVDQGQSVVVRTVYDSVMYVSEVATAGSDQQELSLPITIYETTEDPADVAVAQLHVFVNKVGERIQVGEYCVISNIGDRAYVGSSGSASGERTTWEATLPAGAENLQFEGGHLGGRFVALEGGFADTRPILPGNASVDVSFTYELPYRTGLQVEQAFDLPLNAVVLVLSEEDLGLSGAQLSSAETLDTQMGPALSYTAGPLNRGEPLAFTLVPRDSNESGAWPVKQWNGLAVGTAVLAAAAVAIYLMWRSPSAGAVPAQVRPQVEAIAALDADFEDGQISEKAYREKRRSLKREVRGRLTHWSDD